MNADPRMRMFRLRLWLTTRIDRTGIWLVNHNHIAAAERLWRTCGMW